MFKKMKLATVKTFFINQDHLAITTTTIKK